MKSCRLSLFKYSFILLVFLMLPCIAKAWTDNLENYLGLYKVVATRCEVTKGVYNPCPEIRFFEIVKGIFAGIGPDEAAFVIWKIHEDDPEATYEAGLVKQHKSLNRQEDKLWLFDSKNSDSQEYLVITDGKISGYRFFMTRKNAAGDVFIRDFNYKLVPITRKEITNFRLLYPEATPDSSQETDDVTFRMTADADAAAKKDKLVTGWFLILFGLFCLPFGIGIFLWPDVVPQKRKGALTLPHHPLIIRFLSAPLICIFGIAMIAFGIQSLGWFS